eukprot:g4055.t1
MFKTLITAPLMRMPTPADGCRRIILIDALDECNAQGKNALLDLLVTRFGGASALPPWLRLVVTSRPEGDIVTRLQRRFKPLEMECDGNTADAELYIRHLLQGKVAAGAVEDAVEDAVRLLMERSGGLFLYLRFVRERLAMVDPAQPATLTELRKFPARLDRVYETDFRRVFEGGDAAATWAEAVPLLQMVAAARQPLPIALIEAALSDEKGDGGGGGGDDNGNEDGDGVVVGSCCSGSAQLSRVLRGVSLLFPVRDDGCVHPLHKDVSDWLTAGGGESAQGRPRAGRFHIDRRAGEGRLAAACKRVLRSDVLPAVGTLDGGEAATRALREQLSSQAAAAYALAHGVAHALESADEGGGAAQMAAVACDLRYVEAKAAAGQVAPMVREFEGLAGAASAAQDHDGELQKKGQWRNNWLTRRFELRGSTLRYFVAGGGEMAAVQRGTVTVCGVEDVQPQRGRRPHRFDVRCQGGRTLALAAADAANKNAWVRALRQSTPLAGRARDFGRFAGLLGAHLWQRPDLTLQFAANFPDGLAPVVQVQEGTAARARLERMKWLEWVNKPQGLSQLLLAVPRAHGRGCASGVVYAPDGRRIVSGGEDGWVRVWDAASGEMLMEGEAVAVAEHGGGSVNAVSFSPDGARVASGGDDGHVRVFNSATGEAVAAAEHGGGWVNAVSFSPDGARVASAGRDGHVRVFDAATGEAVAAAEHGGGFVNAVSFSPDGGRVASGGRDGHVRVFNAATGEAVAAAAHGGFSVWAVSFSPDGRRVASGGYDGHVRVFNAATGKAVAVAEHGGGSVNAVSFSADGARVASGGEDGYVRVFDAATGEAVAAAEHGGGRVSAVSFSPDGARVVSGGFDGHVRVFDAVAGEAVAAAEHGGGFVNAVSFSPDGARVASGSDGHVRVFDAATGEAVAAAEHGGGRVYAVIFSADGARVASGGEDGYVRVFDAATGEAVAAAEHGGGRVSAVSFSPDGARVVSGGFDGHVRVFDAATGEAVAAAEHGGGFVNAVSFSPDGALVASGGDDGHMRMFNAATGESVATAEHGGGTVYAVSFSPDGRRVVSGGYDGHVRVFDAATGKAVAAAEHGGGWVSAVSFSPDGTRVTSAGRDGHVRVFDAATGAPCQAQAGGPDPRLGLASAMVRKATSETEDATFWLVTSPYAFSCAFRWLVNDGRFPFTYFSVCTFSAPFFLVAVVHFVRTDLRHHHSVTHIFPLSTASYLTLSLLYGAYQLFAALALFSAWMSAARWVMLMQLDPLISHAAGAVLLRRATTPEQVFAALLVLGAAFAFVCVSFIRPAPGTAGDKVGEFQVTLPSGTDEWRGIAWAVAARFCYVLRGVVSRRMLLARLARRQRRRAAAQPDAAQASGSEQERAKAPPAAAGAAQQHSDYNDYDRIVDIDAYAAVSRALGGPPPEAAVSRARVGVSPALQQGAGAASGGATDAPGTPGGGSAASAGASSSEAAAARGAWLRAARLQYLLRNPQWDDAAVGASAQETFTLHCVGGALLLLPAALVASFASAETPVAFDYLDPSHYKGSTTGSGGESAVTDALPLLLLGAMAAACIAHPVALANILLSTRGGGGGLQALAFETLRCAAVVLSVLYSVTYCDDAVGAGLGLKSAPGLSVAVLQVVALLVLAGARGWWAVACARQAMEGAARRQAEQALRQRPRGTPSLGVWNRQAVQLRAHCGDLMHGAVLLDTVLRAPRSAAEFGYERAAPAPRAAAAASPVQAAAVTAATVAQRATPQPQPPADTSMRPLPLPLPQITPASQPPAAQAVAADNVWEARAGAGRGRTPAAQEVAADNVWEARAGAGRGRTPAAQEAAADNVWEARARRERTPSAQESLRAGLQALLSEPRGAPAAVGADGGVAAPPPGLPDAAATTAAAKSGVSVRR